MLLRMIPLGLLEDRDMTVLLWIYDNSGWLTAKRPPYRLHIMTKNEFQLLDLIPLPAIVVRNRQVVIANAAAIDLLGGHIVDEDVRIALRVPDAVAAILGTGERSVRLEGVSVPGSQWQLTVRLLDSGDRLVLLEDLSVRASVARAHADFVANASHELRTPLASILGYVETLGNPAAGADEATRQKFLDVIRREAERMQALVEDLMSLSRIEAHKHETPTTALDLVAIIRDCAGAVVDPSRINLSLTAEEAHLVGDAGQLAQAIRNLIDNALKYGRPDGQITVSLEVSPHGRILLTVHDDGEGIAPEHLSRVTERFYRVDAGRSRAVGGTGLGLAIVKHIVERHRGRFDLSSSPGKGTTASIILPHQPPI